MTAVQARPASMESRFFMDTARQVEIMVPPGQVNGLFGFPFPRGIQRPQ